MLRNTHFKACASINVKVVSTDGGEVFKMVFNMECGLVKVVKVVNVVKVALMR